MGLGSKLMKIAEEKAKSYDKIRVTHGAGTRIYYEKLGYNLEDYYMVKKLNWMDKIDITEKKTNHGWDFQVTISGNGTTVHQVKLSEKYYEKINLGLTPNKLINASFKFLLEREPKEMILSKFDLQIIANYFPNYEKEIRKYMWWFYKVVSYSVHMVKYICHNSNLSVLGLNMSSFGKEGLSW